MPFKANSIWRVLHFFYNQRVKLINQLYENLIELDSLWIVTFIFEEKIKFSDKK